MSDRDRTTKNAWRVTTLAVALLAVAAASGCNVMERKKLAKIPQLGVIDPGQPHELELSTHPAYVVEPPDQLELRVKPAGYEVDNSSVIVQPDGTIDLGFYGRVPVVGLTLEQLEQRLASHITLRAAEQGDPPKDPIRVSARLADQSRSKVYYVLGTVSTQGEFPITGNETVLRALLRAGLRPNSLPEKAYLVRPHPLGGPDQVLAIDWCGIRDRGDVTTNYQIFPGDRLVVPGGPEPSLIRSLVRGN